MNTNDFVLVSKKRPKKLIKPPIPKDDLIESINIVPIKNNISVKRILCHNMFTRGKCSYENYCVYAHSLEEQKIDIDRKQVYDILKSKNNLNYLNPIKDKNIYESLMQLTNVCFGCENKKCLGGYNCKNGAINTSLSVCYNDFNFGKCTNINCKKIHLTKRGLTPYKYHKEELIVPIQSENIQPKIIEIKRIFLNDINKTNDIDDDNYSLSDDEASPDNNNETINSGDEYILFLIP